MTSSDHESGMYLIEVGGDEGDGVTRGCHLDEAAEHRVPHWSVLVHAMEQVTQPVAGKQLQLLTTDIYHQLRLMQLLLD